MPPRFNVVKFISRQTLIPEFKALEFYPPFLFMGVKITEVSPDFRHLKATLPYRWYGTSPHGTIFGGFMASLADPLHAILCEKLFPNTVTWTQGLSIYFKQPGIKRVHLMVDIKDTDVSEIKAALDDKGRCRHTFQCHYEDDAGVVRAEVQNTVYLRLKNAKSGQRES